MPLVNVWQVTASVAQSAKKGVWSRLFIVKREQQEIKEQFANNNVRSVRH